MLELKMLGVLRALTEVAGFFLVAQGVLFLLAGKARDENFVYQLFCIITRPVLLTIRWMLPKLLAERLIPFVAFFVLFWLWVFLAYTRLFLCRANGLICG